MAAALGLSSCTVTIPDYPERPISDYPSRQTQGDVIVAAHAVVDPTEARRYFRSDLVRDGVLPLLVVIKNSDQQASYIISKEQCALVDSTTGEGVVEASAARVVASLVHPSRLLTIGAGAANDENARQYFESKELKLLTISPGETIQGFVYFQLGPEKSGGWKQKTFRVRLRKPREHEVLEFLLPITLHVSPE